MIYLALLPSLAINGLLVWYIRKLLGKFWFQAEARSKFTTMLTDYQDALKNNFGSIYSYDKWFYLKFLIF